MVVEVTELHIMMMSVIMAVMMMMSEVVGMVMMMMVVVVVVIVAMSVVRIFRCWRCHCHHIVPRRRGCRWRRSTISFSSLMIRVWLNSVNWNANSHSIFITRGKCSRVIISIISIIELENHCRSVVESNNATHRRRARYAVHNCSILSRNNRFTPHRSE